MICEVEHFWQINEMFYMVGSEHLVYLDSYFKSFT